MALETISQIVESKRLSTLIIFLFLEIFMEGAQSATAASQAEVNKHLELGKDFLARGQLADALSHYHAAVEGDPNNYLTYFKRGTVYLALGKARFALSDLTKVLELRPEFLAARAQRGSVHLKLGDYDKAEIDLYHVLVQDGQNEDAQYMYGKINPAREQWDLVLSVMEQGDYATAIALLTQLLEISPWSSLIRETRGKCYILNGDQLSAVSDFRSVNRLTQDSTSGYFRLAKLLYDIGHAADSLKEIRECLKLDPEHKDCFPFYKKIKKIDKFLNDAQGYTDTKEFKECVASAEKVLKNEKDVPMIVFSAKQFMCSCHVLDEEYISAIGHCKEAFSIYKDPNVLCDWAEALIGTEMWDDAVHRFQEAVDLDPNLQRAKDGIEKARRLQKQSERRDYYKILGVKKTATKQEIVKAYRKAAQKWHPDNFQEDEKKSAEKKFIDVAAAKEVLTDPEKRALFDQGEDPLDPESGRNNNFRGGNPFQHFQQGGSPFQFKFHFS